MNRDEGVEIETGAAPDAAVIWLHGLGADGHDFEPVVPELGLDGMAIRFVFPHAPVRPVTINGGMPMRAWYDIRDGAIRREDEAGVRDSQSRVEALIARQVAGGIAPGRIVIAGFSQGGAIALHTALRHRAPLAGILALSTYLPLADTLEREAPAENRTIPILMAHGGMDPVIPLARAMESRDRLESLGWKVLWREYPMAHSVSAEELDDIAAWLRARLATH